MLLIEYKTLNNYLCKKIKHSPMKKIILFLSILTSITINSQVVVKGVAPTSIAGVNYNFEWADPAGGDWSSPDFNLPNTFVQDSLALVVDNSHEGDNPAYAIAHPLANEGCLTKDGEQYVQPSLEGKIAVVWRGSCQFGLKAALAENNGAVGIIIINHSGDPVGMAGGDSGTVIDIPVVMISTMDGQNLLSLMEGTSEPGDPSLVSVSPASAVAGQNLNVTITGENTNFDQNNGTSLSFTFEQGSSSVNSFEIINNTTILANITVPANAEEGLYDITTENASGEALTLTESFSVISSSTPASIVSISPSSASSGETLNVTITGENTNFDQASGTLVSFSFEQASSTIVNSYTIVDDLTLKANITVPENVSEGTYDISTNNSVDGILDLLDGFTVSNNTQVSNAVEMFMGNKQNSTSNDIGSSRDVANGPRYGSMPILMANNGYTFDLGLTVTNFGSDDNVPVLTQSVTGPSGDIYSDVLNLGVLSTGSTVDTLYQTYSGAEFEIGEYIIDYNLSIENETDQDPTDNLISTSFNVTENVLSLARTDESTGELISNSFPRSADVNSDYQTCIRLQDTYPYDSNSVISGLHFAIEKADSAVGSEYIEMKIFEWNDPFTSINGAWENVTFNDLDIVRQQDYICPNDSLNGKMVYVPFNVDDDTEDSNFWNSDLFDAPIHITPGQRYLVCLLTFNPDVAFGYDNAISYNSNFAYYDQPITALSIDGTWYSGWNGNDAPSIGIEFANIPLGISENKNIQGLLYPNPTNSEFKLNLSNVKGAATISVLDVSGKIVKQFNNRNIQQRSTYSISELNNGHYVVCVRLENGKTRNFNMVINK